MQYENKHRKNLEANYLKFWVMSKANIPFLFAVLLIQNSWGLPLGAHTLEEALENRRKFIDKLDKWDQEFFKSKRFYKFLPAVREILKLDLSDEHTKRILDPLFAESPKRSFMRTMLNLANEFDFSVMWVDCLFDHVISGFINPPFEKKDNAIPPKHIKEGIDLNYKVVPKTKSQSDRIENWTLVADAFLGEPDERLDDQAYAETDRKRVQRLKTLWHRVQKSPFNVTLTPKYRKRLQSIFG